MWYPKKKKCSPSPCTPRALWIFQSSQESRKICNPKVRDFFLLEKNPSKCNKYWWTNNLDLVHKQFSWNIEQNVTFDQHRWMPKKKIIFCAKRFILHQHFKSKVNLNAMVTSQCVSFYHVWTQFHGFISLKLVVVIVLRQQFINQCCMFEHYLLFLNLTML